MSYTRLNPAAAQQDISDGSFVWGKAAKYGRIVCMNIDAPLTKVTFSGYRTLGTIPQEWRPSTDVGVPTLNGDGMSTGFVNIRASDGAVRLYAPTANTQYAVAFSYFV